MENRHVIARRAAVGRILRARVSDKEKLERLAELGEQDTARAWRRGYWRGLRKPSAVSAGVLRRAHHEETGQ